MRAHFCPALLAYIYLPYMHLNSHFDCRVFGIEIKCTLPPPYVEAASTLQNLNCELGFTGADSVFVAAGKRRGADETGWFEPNLDLTSRR